MAVKEIYSGSSIPFLKDDSKKASLHPLSKKVIEIIQSKSKSLEEKQISRQFTQIAPDELNRIIDEVVQEFMNTETCQESMADLARIIPLERLQTAVQACYPDHKDALNAAKEMMESAKYYLGKTQEKFSPTLKTRFQSMLDSLIRILESFLTAFGLAEFFKPAENDIHADVKGQKIFMLLTLFSVLTATLLPLLGAAIAGSVVGGALIFIAVLSLIYPYFRPCPSTLPLGDNWTKKYLEGILSVREGRKTILDEIAHTLLSSKNVKTHPLLIGRSGVGKTETVKSFVAAIERGDYPELKGKKVFYFNTADLVNSSEMFGGGNKILKKIKDAIGRHGEKIILVFDEIHLACQKKENSAIGEQLKTMLDPGSENFPYVIGMTTEEEYFKDIFVNNPAFARRFKRISIENTESTDTLEILHNTILQQAPKVLVEQGALKHLLKESKAKFSEKAPQPATALKILSKCIQRTAESQKSPLEEKVEKKRKKIQSIYSKGAIGQGRSLLPYQKAEGKSKVKELEQELEFLVRQLNQEKENTKKFFQARDRLSSVKTAMFESVLRVSKMKTGSRLAAHDQNEAAAFLLLSHYVAPALEEWVRNQAAKLGITSVLDSKLVDTVIAEEIENDRRVQEIVEQGKKQIKERNEDVKKS